jgi:hypothetical protein
MTVPGIGPVTASAIVATIQPSDHLIVPPKRWLLHDHIPRSVEVSDQPLRHDVSVQFVGVVLALAALMPQREACPRDRQARRETVSARDRSSAEDSAKGGGTKQEPNAFDGPLAARLAALGSPRRHRSRSLHGWQGRAAL